MPGHGVFFENLSAADNRIQIQTADVLGLTVPVPAAATGFAIGDSKLLRTPTDVADLGLPAGDVLRQLDAVRSNFGGPVILNGVDPGVDEAATIAALTGSASLKTGVHAHQNDKSNHGIKSTVIAAPGYSAAGLHSALVASATKQRAIAVLDGPNTDTATAITDAGGIGDAEGRAWFADPWCTLGAETIAASAYFGAICAQTDYWKSPSNKVLQGLDGTSRPIGFGLTDDNDEAASLNNARVATIIRESGFRTWGNQSLAGGGFDMPFITQVRTDDRIKEAIAAAHLFWVDAGLTKTFATNLVNSVNAFLRQQTALGRLIGAEAFLDPNINTPAALAAGDIYVDYDITFVPPAKSINFRRRVTNRFFASITG